MAQSSLPLKTVPVSEAVGNILCHDITEIVPGTRKGPIFRKGHVVRPEDIPVLLRIGKENLYVMELHSGLLHEDDAAYRIAKAVTEDNISLTTPKEGRIDFIAPHQGLLRIDTEQLTHINGMGEIALATLHSFQEVKKGQAIGGTRIIPLLIQEEKIRRLEQDISSPVVEVLPFKAHRIGVVTTGSEVYSGRIKDAFGPILQEKFAALGSQVFRQIITNDTMPMTSNAISELLVEGADMVVVTGGMSVDPDDRTPSAIRAAAGKEISYGAPTFPGAMFMLAYKDTTPILGLPGCVMYHRASIFDLIVPRLLAGITVSHQDIASLGHGGYCTACSECRYPLCFFGKS